MFIRNIKDVKSKTYVCGKTLGNFLIKNGIPLLGRSDDLMIFAQTKELQQVLSNLPVFLKILRGVGVING